MIPFKGGRKFQGGWTAAIPAIVGAVGAIGGGLLSKSGQQDANARNLQIWREQRDWSTMMSNTEIQRRVYDMKAAGINPMLSVMGGGGASTPSVGAPTMQNENAGLGEGVARAAASAAQAASLRLANAQARKTEAEAAITEAEVPWSSQNAQIRSETLFSQSRSLASEVGTAREREHQATLSTEQMVKMNELLLEYQRLANRGEKLDLSEKKALSDLYESVKGVKGVEKFLPVITTLLRK